MAESVSIIDEYISTPDGLRIFKQEQFIFAVTERICEIMHEQGVSRRELAKRIGKTKGWVSQALDGGHNLTLRTISDFLLALERQPDWKDKPLEKP